MNRDIQIQMPHNHGDITDILSAMPEEGRFLRAAETFKQLCDGTRLQILWLLCHSEECVLNIAATVKMSPPAVSHHLRGLKQAGLIVSRRDGKEVYYSLATTKEARLLHHLIDDFFEISCPADTHQNRRNYDTSK